MLARARRPQFVAAGGLDAGRAPGELRTGGTRAVARGRSRPHLLVLLALGAHAAGALACSRGDAPALSKEDPGGDGILQVPVPPENGPKLVALRPAPVMGRPARNARKLGELSPGAFVARSAEPYGRKDCPGGWYAVRPRGFVCAGDDASLDAQPAAPLPAPPALDRPLPYRYGRARVDGVPLYVRVPSPDEQATAEPERSRRERDDDGDHVGSSANDVPLDARGVPTGPPVLMPGGDGVSESLRRTAASWFAFAAGDAPSPRSAGDAAGEVAPSSLRRQSGVAITASFQSEGRSGLRRFGITPDGRLVPVDRLRPALGSTFHGIDLEKVGLPVAFVHKLGVHVWSMHAGKPRKDDEELERRTAVPLTGKFRTVDGVRFEQAREGYWLRTQDIVVIVKRSKFPDFVTGTQKWLDVSLANQTLTAYEGKKPVYATLISSGRDVLKDPQTSASTVRGTFRIKAKYVTRAIDPREVSGAFDVADAPWVLEFEPGYALTGMYWSDGVGEAHGFHDVAMTPIDARRIWTWADPQVPDGWHGVTDDGQGEGTLVHVRP